MLQQEHNPRRLELRREGEQTPLLVQNASEHQRPFIHPWQAPDGDGTLTENVPPHHPWQHGLYVGLNDVNGVGFWAEGKTDGTFHPLPLAPATIEGNIATWEVVTEWRDPEGQTLLTETQAWRLSDLGSRTQLDIEWTLTAAVTLTFGKYAYGGLFLRMPWRPDANGVVLTSEGHTDSSTADQQRARWVAIAMALPDRENGTAGIAMLDHPGNPEHPAPWRVDGQLGVVPSRCIAGSWQLGAGAATVNRYRLLSFVGAPMLPRIESTWRDFAHE